MKLIIDVPEEEYNTGQLVHYFGCYSDKLDLVIYNGTPLPKGHGRLIDADRLQDNISRDEREALTKHQVWLKASIYNPEAPTIIEADKEVQDDSNGTN